MSLPANAVRLKLRDAGWDYWMIRIMVLSNTRQRTQQDEDELATGQKIIDLLGSIRSEHPEPQPLLTVGQQNETVLSVQYHNFFIPDPSDGSVKLVESWTGESPTDMPKLSS